TATSTASTFLAPYPSSHTVSSCPALRALPRDASADRKTAASSRPVLDRKSDGVCDPADLWRGGPIPKCSGSDGHRSHDLPATRKPARPACTTARPSYSNGNRGTSDRELTTPQASSAYARRLSGSRQPPGSFGPVAQTEFQRP